MVEIPETLQGEIDALVTQGRFPNRETAVSELLRLGLAALRARSGPGRPPVPGRPAPPPGVNEPHDDRPISVDPTDVNWAP